MRGAAAEPGLSAEGEQVLDQVRRSRAGPRQPDQPQRLQPGVVRQFAERVDERAGVVADDVRLA